MSSGLYKSMGVWFLENFPNPTGKELTTQFFVLFCYYYYTTED